MPACTAVEEEAARLDGKWRDPQPPRRSVGRSVGPSLLVTMAIMSREGP